MGNTGKSYEEILKPSISCDAGKWVGTRVFKVETSSPSIAILTIQNDASIPLGTEWDEGCDTDFSGGDTSDIKMKSKNYTTASMNSSNVMVTVSYEDSRYNVEFNETTLGFVRKYWKFGLTSDTIYQAVAPIKAWDSTHLTTATAYAPTIVIAGSSVTAPDRRIGWDGETLAGTNVETPTLTYGEVWRLNDDDSGTFGSSVYVPGVEEIEDYEPRLWDDEVYILAQRTGYTWTIGDPLNLSLAQALFGFVGTVNSFAFRNFPIRSLRFEPPQLQQVGSQAYICNFEWTFMPPYYYNLASTLEDPLIYVGASQLETLEKAGWDYLWYKYKAGTDKQEVEEIRVAQVYPALDFSATGL